MNDYIPPRRSDGTIQQRRVPLPWPAGEPFRILSIDGGGIRGILPVSVLAEIERRFLGGRSIAHCFDMISGTSTGGIIALGLAHGLTATAIQTFYLDRGDRIFPRSTAFGRFARLLTRVLRPGYDRRQLENNLLRIFGETTFGDARVRLCIPSFEGRHGEPWIYKTPHHPDYSKDKSERMVRIALATSAAPTYFRSVWNNGYVMVDGGLWANNPTMIAVVDALACFDVPREQVRVLSLGCGEIAFKVRKPRAVGGLLHWRDAIRGASRAQSLNALGQTYLLLGKPNVMRLDAPESSDPIALDDHKRASTELPKMARSLVEASGHQVSSMFCVTDAASFRPIAP